MAVSTAYLHTEESKKTKVGNNKGIKRGNDR